MMAVASVVTTVSKNLNICWGQNITQHDLNHFKAVLASGHRQTTDTDRQQKSKTNSHIGYNPSS
jgi:hypothetical protein